MIDKKVYQGQSFLDKVVENTGSIEEAFAMSLLNGIAMTDDVVIGQELKLSPIKNKGVVAFFNENNRPATSISEVQKAEISTIGIGVMRISTNFIVG